MKTSATQRTRITTMTISEFICKAYRNNALSELDPEDDGDVYGYPKAFCPYPTHFYQVLLENVENDR